MLGINGANSRHILWIFVEIYSAIVVTVSSQYRELLSTSLKYITFEFLTRLQLTPSSRKAH